MIARYQHDAAAPVKEIGVVQVQGAFTLSDNVVVTEKGQKTAPRGSVNLRLIMSQVIERVNTSKGGWCEILGTDGVIYRHSPTGGSGM